MSEIKLTIDEVIEHCEKHIEVGERVFTKEELNIEPFMNNSIKQYWEHKQVAEWLRELKHLRGAKERIIKNFEKEIKQNPEASLREYRAGFYKAIEIVKEEGGIE